MPPGGGHNNVNKKAKAVAVSAAPSAGTPQPFTLQRGPTQLTGPVPSPAEFTNRPK